MASRSRALAPKDSPKINITFPVSDSVFAQIKAIADDREWTLTHVLHKIVPLGLEVYLNQITLPSTLELTGKPEVEE